VCRSHFLSAPGAGAVREAAEMAVAVMILSIAWPRMT
jgi:hypothetical protein